MEAIDKMYLKCMNGVCEYAEIADKMIVQIVADCASRVGWLSGGFLLVMVLQCGVDAEGWKQLKFIIGSMK